MFCNSNLLLFLISCFSALFLVDAVNEMYLWHGWWPQSDEDSDSRASTTGSAETRWSNDRRLAMETTKSYAEGSYSHSGVHNHVLVDVMGKQLPFLKISPCVNSKSICSLLDPSLHSSKTREQEYEIFAFVFFSRELDKLSVSK